MVKSSVRVVLIVAATLFTSVACAAHRTYDRQVSAPPGGRFVFVTNVGSVTVRGGNVHDVIVHAAIRGAQSFLDHIHISTQRTASGVTLSAHAGPSWFHLFNFGWHRVRFTVEVPRDYPVNLRTSGGDVDVRDLSASVRARTSGGDARVQGVTGSLKLQSDGGDVRLHAINGTMHVYTSGGDIVAGHLNGPTQLSSSGGDVRVRDSTGDLRVSTSGGDLLLNGTDGKIRALTSGGDIRAALAANHGIRMRSAGGDITLLLPHDARATIDAASDGGDVSSDLPITTVQIVAASQVRGTIGGGGPAIILRASGGDIHIGSED